MQLQNEKAARHTGAVKSAKNDNDIANSNVDAMMPLPDPVLDDKLMQLRRTDSTSYLLSEMNRTEMNARNDYQARYHQIHDATDVALAFVGSLSKGSLVEPFLEQARSIRNNVRTLEYGYPGMQLAALKSLGTETAIAAAGILTKAQPPESSLKLQNTLDDWGCLGERKRLNLYHQVLLLMENYILPKSLDN